MRASLKTRNFSSTVIASLAESVWASRAPVEKLVEGLRLIGMNIDVRQQ